MRQRRWLELVKDYDCEIKYHPGKANVVADVLSRKKQSSLGCVLTYEEELVKELENLRLEVVVPPQSMSELLAALVIKPDLCSRIIEARRKDEKQEMLWYQIRMAHANDCRKAHDNVILYKNRLTVPNDFELKNEILEEAHSTLYSAHPGWTKMYRNLKPSFHWSGMKRDIAKFVEWCLACQWVKFLHQWPYGQLHPLEISEWKWDHITMDFVTKLPRTRRGNMAIWVIVDRLTKCAHFLLIPETYGADQLAKIYI